MSIQIDEDKKQKEKVRGIRALTTKQERDEERKDFSSALLFPHEKLNLIVASCSVECSDVAWRCIVRRGAALIDFSWRGVA